MRSQPRQRANRQPPEAAGAWHGRDVNSREKRALDRTPRPRPRPLSGARDALPERAVRIAAVSARRAQPAPLVEKLLEQGGRHAGRRRTGVAQLGARRRPPAPTAAPPPPWAPQSYDRN